MIRRVQQLKLCVKKEKIINSWLPLDYLIKQKFDNLGLNC